MANPKFYPPNNYDPNIHSDTSGTLPPGRLDVGDIYDQEPPLSTGPNLVAYDPSRDKSHPDWEALADLIPAVDDVVPEGSLVADFGRINNTLYDAVDWRAMRTDLGEEIALTLEAGAGRVSVTATVPVSVYVTDGGSREIEVRLWADGYLFEPIVLEPASDSDAGDTDLATFGPYSIVLPPLQTHVFRPEFRIASGNPLTIYSTGCELAVVADPEALGGDLSGFLPDPTVVAIQGNPVDAASPAENDVLTWNGSTWVPAAGDPALVILRGDIGDIPAASTEGRLYFAQDEGKIYRDNGASWDEVTPTVAGIGALGYDDFLFQKAGIYNALFGRADVNNNLGPAIADTETTTVTRDFSTDPNDWTTLASFAGVTTWPDPTVLMNVLADFSKSDDGTAELEFRLLVDSVGSDTLTVNITEPYYPIALSFWEAIIEDGGSDIDFQWRRASGGSFAGTVDSNYRRIEIYTGYRPVYGDDARLTDDRTPLAHAASHEDGGSDELELAPAQITGTAVVDSDARLTDDRTPTAHAASHQDAGSDELELAPAQITGTAVVDADARLTDARTPTVHATSHEDGGSDELELAPAQITGTAVVQTIVDAKGDLLVGTAADTVDRLAVSATDGQLLAADSAASTGLAWIDNFTTDIRAYVKNQSGSPMTKGQAVYISGATGTNVLVALSDADTEGASSKTLGLLYQDIANGSFGYVITEGLLVGVNTNAATAAGDSVWLSGTAGDRVYGAPPAEPAHSVYLGVVARKHAVNGEILVKVQNGYELDELHNVSAASPSDNDILAWDTTSSMWKNQTASNAGVAASGHTHSSTETINVIIDGGGSAITTGVKADLLIPYACTITAARLLADQSGSIVVDIWKDTYANFPPTVGDTVTASAKPTLSSAQKYEDTTLTGWTTALAAGDYLRFNVDSATSVQRVTLAITITRSI